MISVQTIEQYITEQLPNVTKLDSYGYQFFFYESDQVLPFVTIATSDNEHDNKSNLDRDGVFRVNIGVSKDSFNKLFTDTKTDWDYTTLNRFMPHPDYAAQHYICILNPADDLLEETIRFIEEAHLIAKRRFDKKQSAKMRKSG
jgi:hypothetical protein